ncbi:MAG: PTS cellbiose transporter subunit IIC [Ruminococcus sp.]|nr:PTS cellbiose transporter subunit IIC [Ruminococcus sp.]
MHRGYKPCYQLASQGAGFHFVQALLLLPLWLPLKGFI